MQRFSNAMFCAVVFACSAKSQTLPAGGTDAATPYRFSTNADWVVLNAAVRDRQGWFVADLAQPDFAVYEDGIAQTIGLFRHEDIAVGVGLVVDHSGSMAPKLAEVIAAARTFVESSRPDDEMFVVNFNETVTVEISNRPDQLARAISSRPTLGKTALYDAILKALERLKTSKREKKVVIVVSDGGDNASSHTLAEVLNAVERSNALVYAIGVFDEDDPDHNGNVLRRLARISGGEAYFPRQLTEVVSICQRIAGDIRNQYTLGYVSSNAAQPGVYRSIRLAARSAGKGKLMVRTRSGYISAGAAK